VNLQLPSPLQQIRFRGVDFYLKRDDLISDSFSGNKARKFMWFLDHEMPHIRQVCSYGSPQSNAMYSLSVLAKMRGWDFHYYVDHVASYLKADPHGNYLYALQNGMQLHEEKAPRDLSEDTLWIEEGGRQAEAEYGIKMLAEELARDFGGRDLSVFLPSGTGTTALYLQKHLPFPVLTTPCVGDAAYLKAQFLSLEEDESVHPTILVPPKKYHFGKLYREFFKIWIELKEKTGVTFDLLYDPPGWLVLLEHLEKIGNEICYIHQGGLIGNESMLKRYERKFQQS